MSSITAISQVQLRWASQPYRNHIQFSCSLGYVSVGFRQHQLPLKLYRSINQQQTHRTQLWLSPTLSSTHPLKTNFADALLPIQPNCQRSNSNHFRSSVELLSRTTCFFETRCFYQRNSIITNSCEFVFITFSSSISLVLRLLIFVTWSPSLYVFWIFWSTANSNLFLRLITSASSMTLSSGLTRSRLRQWWGENHPDISFEHKAHLWIFFRFR